MRKVLAVFQFCRHSNRRKNVLYFGQNNCASWDVIIGISYDSFNNYNNNTSLFFRRHKQFYRVLCGAHNENQNTALYLTLKYPLQKKQKHKQ